MIYDKERKEKLLEEIKGNSLYLHRDQIHPFGSELLTAI